MNFCSIVPNRANAGWISTWRLFFGRVTSLYGVVWKAVCDYLELTLFWIIRFYSCWNQCYIFALFCDSVLVGNSRNIDIWNESGGEHGTANVGCLEPFGSVRLKGFSLNLPSWVKIRPVSLFVPTIIDPPTLPLCLPTCFCGIMIWQEVISSVSRGGALKMQIARITFPTRRTFPVFIT